MAASDVPLSHLTFWQVPVTSYSNLTQTQQTSQLDIKQWVLLS